ncbi:DUF6526 family protein [Sporosarcina limicola]|uniref:Membrane protein n=1 Tax=Sporosarcina limicola TaxID=34101 RepID=A0A927R7E3_9BACL|nr:DUF6526 family protein [Sporosarcina limicola]MBE1555899.1 putative membrane protein [Sporosarcina limicola]
MTTKPTQSYENHTRFHPLQHFILLPLSVITLVAALIHTVTAIVRGEFTLSDFLLLALVIMSIIVGLLARVNALKVQDRVIRMEEQFRYYMLTNEPIDSRLTVQQLIALRFASNEEFPALARKAARDELTPAQIKREIHNWRIDKHRV